MNWKDYVSALWAREGETTIPVEEGSTMNFVFDYTLHGETRHIVISIDKAIIVEAQKYDVDLIRVENETKEAIDCLFYKITASSFWHRTMTTVADVLQIPHKGESPPGDTNDRIQTG